MKTFLMILSMEIGDKTFFIGAILAMSHNRWLVFVGSVSALVFMCLISCIIGLSALMTTTMVRMEDTIRLVRERNLPIKVLVGGAAVTQAFADAIGADAYCEDAVSAVRAAKQFVTG